MDFDPLALLDLLVGPTQIANGLVGLLAAGVVHFAVVLQGAIEGLGRLQKPFEHIGHCIPSVHQHSPVADLTAIKLTEHIENVFDFGLPVGIGIEDAKVNEPELVGFGIEIDAVDHPDPFDESVRVA